MVVSPNEKARNLGEVYGGVLNLILNGSVS